MNIFNKLQKATVLAALALSLGFTSGVSANPEIKQLKHEGLDVFHSVREKLLDYRRGILAKIERIHQKFEAEENRGGGESKNFNHKLFAEKMMLKCMEKEVDSVIAKVYEQELNFGHHGKVVHHREGRIDRALDRLEERRERKYNEE